MNRLRVLVVDDEELARQRLAGLLASYPHVEVVGEAADGEEALATIAKLQPDVVFLDIQMPGCSGVEVAASLPADRPTVVFCTAYDEFAVQAFEVNAVDYLLKPVTRGRLAKTMERLGRKAGKASTAAVIRSLGPTRFLARRGGRYQVIPVSEVIAFTMEEGVTRLWTRETSYWIDPSLAELEERLGEEDFFRVSRQSIVRLEQIEEVHPLMGGSGRVKLRNGKLLPVSRRRFKSLLERLAGS
ncbi:MAG TPA: response regulator [Acidobacteriota bacterium]|jgi:two-component system LytT family response regulator|nr:response regulator [Acidobacteriota bacterium]HRV07875.1 response regulator [Acidobacteriota bacterium]